MSARCSLRQPLSALCHRHPLNQQRSGIPLQPRPSNPGLLLLSDLTSAPRFPPRWVELALRLTVQKPPQRSSSVPCYLAPKWRLVLSPPQPKTWSLTWEGAASCHRLPVTCP